MANLNVTFCGVPFSNPVVLGSATPSWDGEGMKIAGLAGAAGVVPKTIGPVQSWAAHPRNGRLHIYRVAGHPVGMINIELFTTMTREQWISKELRIAKEGGARIIASVLAMPDPGETADLVAEIEETGLVDVLELNVSCPMPNTTVGMHIGKDARLAARQVAAARKAAKAPLCVKLTPNVSDMPPIAMACRDAGVDGIVISNSIRSFAGVDIDTGRPRLRAYGGYTGPAIKPIIQRHLSETARALPGFPIMALGGVMTPEDIVEYIMLGATLVQTATAVMWHGYDVIPRLIKGLGEWMESKGVQSLDEIRGIALPHIERIEVLATMKPLFARVDGHACTRCGICRQVCFYRAVEINERTATVARDRCDGCGLCAEFCAASAIRLEE